MKKALFVATVVGFIAAFEQSDIKLLQSMGYEVHLAANTKIFADSERLRKLDSLGVIKHDIPFARNPFKKTNITAYKQLKHLMKSEQFDLVHCHTPVGGVLGRLAARATHVTLVLYTAHGFHFFKGCPLKNRMLFYPIEKYMSRYTDILITINNEDYQVANKKFHAKQVKRIHGVGIDINKFANPGNCRIEKRRELGIKDDEIMLLSVGELDRDKNHIELLRAMKTLAQKKYKCCIAGRGPLKEVHQKYIDDNGLQNCVTLLGYRTDIAQLLQAADIYVFPSLFEGLSVALMEAVAARLPIACSEVRGNVDTVITTDGYFNPKKPETLIKVIEHISNMTNEEKESMKDANFQNLLKYQLSEVQKEMMVIYKTADDEIIKARNK